MTFSAANQQSRCVRYGSLYMPPASDQKVGIALATLEMQPLNALRHPPDSGTCGWYIWGGETLGESADFFQPLHVGHLAAHCPAMLPYLALAPGWRVLLAPGHEDVWYDELLLSA